MQMWLVWGSLFFISLHWVTVDAFAERILVRGRRGPIRIFRPGPRVVLSRRPFFPRPRVFNPGFNDPLSVAQPLSGSLLNIGGRLFERNRFGQIRPLFIDPNTGALLNATEPTTADEVEAHYSRGFNNFSGRDRELVSRFLENRGVFPEGSLFPQDPFGSIGQGPRCGTGGCGVGPPGPHGVGGGLPPDFGGNNRGVADPLNPFDAEGRVQPALCRNINAAVCAGASSTKQELAQIEAQGKQFIDEFLAQNKMSFDRFARAMAEVEAKGTPDDIPSQQTLSDFGRFHEFLQTKFPGIKNIVESIRNNVATAIDTLPIEASAKQGMKDKLSQLRIFTGPPTDAQSRLEAQNVKGWAISCGADGFIPQAFAVRGLNDVVICPGLLIRALLKGDSSELEHFLLHTLGHECTHHFGADGPQRNPQNGRIDVPESPFRGQFTGYLQCLARRFRGIDPDRMGGEIVADLVGARALRQKLRGLSPAQALEVIKKSTSILCGSPNDGIHPPGSFRLNEVILPEVGEALGCDTSAFSCRIGQEGGTQ